MLKSLLLATALFLSPMTAYALDLGQSDCSKTNDWLKGVQTSGYTAIFTGNDVAHDGINHVLLYSRKDQTLISVTTSKKDSKVCLDYVEINVTLASQSNLAFYRDMLDDLLSDKGAENDTPAQKKGK